jgi:uncharacterized Fe-S cluster-containing radical SAM superfamily protein
MERDQMDSSSLKQVGEPVGVIDTEKFSARLRRRGIQIGDKRVLVTKFEGSKQASDFSVPGNCGGFGRIHHFRRQQPAPWPDNPLPIDPAAKALALGRIDEIEAQVFQNAICSWRCWYCFVDFDLLSANLKFAEFKTVDELLDLYASENMRPQLIDLSGGQPDLVPEWSAWFIEALGKRGMLNGVYVWSDDNLSNDYLWRYLSSEQIARLARCSRYGRVGCFKGFDEGSFAFNTKASPDLFAEQFRLMRRLVSAGFDVYGYVTLTASESAHLHLKMANFVDRLQERVHPLFPLRTVPLRILPFTPTKDRIGAEQSRAFGIQEDAVVAWSEELCRRFSPAEVKQRITEHQIVQA